VEHIPRGQRAGGRYHDVSGLPGHRLRGVQDQGIPRGRPDGRRYTTTHGQLVVVRAHNYLGRGIQHIAEVDRQLTARYAVGALRAHFTFLSNLALA
jgi:hypothetical protein